MQFLKNNMEKVALLFFVIALILVSLILWSDVQTWSNKLDQQSDFVTDAGVDGDQVTPVEDDQFNALQKLNQPDSEWPPPENETLGSLVKPPGFIWCANANCRHWIPANAAACPFCSEKQGDMDKQIVDSGDQDSDGDGIPDSFEQKYEFLDPSNPLDAVEDFDNDFFSNYAEYKAETAPDNPNSHPLLVTRLFLLGVTRDPFNATLRQITADEDRPKDSWDIQVEVFKDGNKRTQFTGLGKKLAVDNVEYEIVEIEKVEEEVFNPSTNAKVMVDRSFIVLKNADGEEVKLVRAQAAFNKEDTVRFGLVLDPNDRTTWRTYSVTSDQQLTLTDANGNEEKYSVKVDSPRSVLLAPAGDSEVKEGEAQAQKFPITGFTREKLEAIKRSQGITSRMDRGMNPEMMPGAFDPGMMPPDMRF